MPLVLNFHGFGSNAEQQARYSRLPEKADEEGFIVVTPDGVNNMWNITATGDDNPDIAFVRDLLAKLQDELCFDPGRIYATGISNGSAFSQRMACALPEIRAVGAVAAVSTPRDCARPVPVVFFHGTEDVCVPYDGGPLTCGLLRVSIPPIPDMVAGWARHNGCDEPPVEASAAENVRTSTYTGCDDGAGVVLYTVEGGGHTWPGSAGPARLGPSTNEIDATDVMWEFFAAR